MTDSTPPFASSRTGKQLEADYTDAFNSWKQTPTPQTRSQLLKVVDPVINKALYSYGGAAQGSPTLRSRARQEALRAFETYDPAKGSLQTHLLSNLRRLQRVGAQETQIISVPEQVALDRRHLDEAETELAISLGRDPSDIELADVIGLSPKRIQYIRQGRNPVAVGQVLAGQPPEEQTLPASQIPGYDPMGEGWEELVYNDLGPVDQLVYDYLLGKHGRERLSTGEIARKLNLSHGAISQRANKIQGMIDERWTTGVM